MEWPGALKVKSVSCNARLGTISPDLLMQNDQIVHKIRNIMDLM